MPSSVFTHAVIGRRPQGTSFQTAKSFRPSPIFMSPFSLLAMGEDAAVLGPGAPASTSFSGYTNTALAYPFQLASNVVVMKMWWCNGTTATTDRADVGIYTEAGALVVKTTSSPTIATANAIQEADCTDTLLVPGRYWCAYAQSGLTATPLACTAGSAGLWRFMGAAQMASGMVSNVLVSTFVPAAYTLSAMNIFGFAGRTQVA